jgi:hypothetical protein
LASEEGGSTLTNVFLLFFNNSNPYKYIQKTIKNLIKNKEKLTFDINASLCCFDGSFAVNIFKSTLKKTK